MVMRASEEAVKGVAAAAEKWENAPMHVKALAGDYVRPMLFAMQVQSMALVSLDREVQALKRGANHGA